MVLSVTINDYSMSILLCVCMYLCVAVVCKDWSKSKFYHSY